MCMKTDMNQPHCSSVFFFPKPTELKIPLFIEQKRSSGVCQLKTIHRYLAGKPQVLWTRTLYSAHNPDSNTSASYTSPISLISQKKAAQTCRSHAQIYRLHPTFSPQETKLLMGETQHERQQSSPFTMQNMQNSPQSISPDIIVKPGKLDVCAYIWYTYTIFLSQALVHIYYALIERDSRAVVALRHVNYNYY